MKKEIVKHIKLLCLAITLLCSNLSYGANIIFDLGGVLIGANKTYMIRQVGFYNFFMFLLRLNNPFSLKNRLYFALDQIPAISQNTYGAKDGNNGTDVPNIMCDWLTGVQSSEAILQQIYTLFEKNPDIFYNTAEKNLITKIIDMMFVPETFSKSTSIIKDGLEFVKTCKEQSHNIFVLSNWDKESFVYVLKRFPELFSLFEKEQIVISGQIGMIKPDPQIYQYVLKTYSLKPEECIFYDDQKVNVQAAENLGIHGVICDNMNYKKMVQELDAFVEKIRKK